MAGLDAWLGGGTETQSQPVLVMGREGMGKTWAVLDWLQSRLDQLPMVVLAPSSSISTPISDRAAFIEFIARCLRDLDEDSGRDQTFWESRIVRLLRRPANEGPVLVLL